MNKIAAPIAATGKVTLMYSRGVLKDIKPETFTRKPKGVEMNHPSWIFGHLTLYVDTMLFGLIEREDLAESAADLEEMYSFKSKCADDPNGASYAEMEEITSRFFRRMEAFIEALAETPDSVLEQALPKGAPFADMISTKGGVVNFMLNAHTMTHMGQISAWRRTMGLGECM